MSGTHTRSQKLLEKLESFSIVPSRDVLELEDCAEPELKYLLGNLLSDEDIKQVESYVENKPSVLDANAVSDEKFVQRFSRFSLMSDHLGTKDETRVKTLASIINEEKLRSHMNLRKSLNCNGNNRKSLVLSRGDNFLKSKAAFRRIQRKLEDLKRFCPSIYYCQDDIITIWGNLVEHSQNLFRIKRDV